MEKPVKQEIEFEVYNNSGTLLKETESPEDTFRPSQEKDSMLGPHMDCHGGNGSVSGSSELNDPKDPSAQRGDSVVQEMILDVSKPDVKEEDIKENVGVHCDVSSQNNPEEIRCTIPKTTSITSSAEVSEETASKASVGNPDGSDLELPNDQQSLQKCQKCKEISTNLQPCKCKRQNLNCKICGAAFAEDVPKDLILKHMNNHGNLRYIKKAKISNPTEKQLKSYVCNESGSERESTQQHHLKVPGHKKKGDNENSLICYICGKSMLSKLELKKHILSDHVPKKGRTTKDNQSCLSLTKSRSRLKLGKIGRSDLENETSDTEKGNVSSQSLRIHDSAIHGKDERSLREDQDAERLSPLKEVATADENLITVIPSTADNGREGDCYSRIDGSSKFCVGNLRKRKDDENTSFQNTYKVSSVISTDCLRKLKQKISVQHSEKETCMDEHEQSEDSRASEVPQTDSVEIHDTIPTSTSLTVSTEPENMFPAQSGVQNATQSDKLNLQSCKKCSLNPCRCIKKCFKCKTCGKMFVGDVSKDTIIMHMAEHGGVTAKKGTDDKNRCSGKSLSISNHSTEKVKNFKCSECNKTFVNTGNLNKHIRKQHGREPVPKNISSANSDEQASVASSKSNKKSQPADEKGRFQCRVCEQEYSTQRNLRKHEQRYHNKCEGAYKCDVCGKTFTFQSCFTAHQKQHGIDAFVTCSICGHQSSSDCKLDKHMYRIHGVKAYQCKLCDALYAYSVTLLSHMRISHTSEIFLCEICLKPFLTAEECAVHKETCKPSKKCDTKDATVSLLDSVNPARKYKCKECGKDYVGSSGLKQHMLSKHYKKKPYVCKVCQKGFYEKNVLRQHFRRHTGEKPYLCEICSNTFVTLTQMKQHMASVHSKRERLCMCNVCGKGFFTKRDLKGHMNTHTRENRHKCPHCDKCYAQHSTLVIHQRSHTGEKPYKCRICGSKFASSSVLRKHEFYHTAKRRFKCGLCEKMFKAKHQLERHQQVHTGIKPYKCTQCGKRLGCLTAVKKHKAWHEKIRKKSETNTGSESEGHAEVVEIVKVEVTS